MSPNRHQKSNTGFTLIEIMVVVGIIGLMLAVALPVFGRMRVTSQTNACIANLYQISAAKERWAVENKKQNGDTIPASGPIYEELTSIPTCPAGGDYTIGIVGTKPTCSIATHIF